MTKFPALSAVAAALGMSACGFPPPAPASGAAAVIPEPELVQPDVISTEREETFPAVDPVDGSLWFSVYEGDDWDTQTIVRAPREGSGWGAPAPVFGPGEEWRGRAPRFSADGRRVYFTSNRSATPGGARADMNIWMMERAADGRWGEPRMLPAPVNSGRADIHATEAANGDLYLASRREGTAGLSDIFRIPRTGGGWGPAERLPVPVNDERSQPDLLVGPDGRWMILVISRHPQGLGEDDLFLVRREGDGWGTPQPLPAPINSAEYEYGPALSPDGTMLYFTSQRRGSADVYRIPVSALGLASR